MTTTARILSPYAAMQLVRRPKIHNERRDHYGVHWWDDVGGTFDSATDHNSERAVDVITYGEFSAGRVVEAAGPVLGRPARPDAVMRLESFLKFGDHLPSNDPAFNILTANCEHFARYVVYGNWYSEQVSRMERSMLGPLLRLGTKVFGQEFVPAETPHPLRDHPLPE